VFDVVFGKVIQQLPLQVLLGLPVMFDMHDAMQLLKHPQN
jgi:hypothetical protein